MPEYIANRLAVLACLVPLFFLAGCAQPAPSKHSTADRKFAQITGEFISGYLAWRPQTGTSLGLHRYDGKITDFSPASLQAELDRLKSFRQKLAALDTSTLSPAALFDCHLLQSAVESELFQFEEMQVYWKDPMLYAEAIDLNIYIKRNFAPLPERLKSIIAIEKQIPKMLATARGNLAECLAKPFVETAIQVSKGAADFLAKDLVEAVQEVKDERALAEFKKVNARAIAELQAYAAWLEKAKLPKSHLRYAMGKERFQKMLRVQEGIRMSPEKILEMGLRELRQEQQRFAEAARQIDPDRTPSEVFKQIQKEHPTAGSLIPDTTKNLEAIRQFLVEHKIVSLPSAVRATVEETPKYSRATTFASMDTPGPFETKATEAYYYVTPVEAGWTAQQQEEWLTAFNYYTTDVVSTHEVYPGHYVQFLHLNASPLTPLEKIFTSYAFVEGWAHYAEQMMIEEGFGAGESASDDIRAAKIRLAQSDEALLRLCRLCVSIKTHCQGLSLEDATRFFEENCYYEHKPACQEALRGTFDPGYLYYSLGKLAFLKLRKDMQASAGIRYSLQHFHDEVLRHGAPPIRLLREVLIQGKGRDEIF